MNDKNKNDLNKFSSYWSSDAMKPYCMQYTKSDYVERPFDLIKEQIDYSRLEFVRHMILRASAWLYPKWGMITEWDVLHAYAIYHALKEYEYTQYASVVEKLKLECELVFAKISTKNINDEYEKYKEKDKAKMLKK